MNPRNKTKIALIKPTKDTLAMWNSWCDGMYAAFQELGERFHVKVFGYAEHPATIKKGNFYLQLTHNISSLKYWLDNFKPEYIFGWGPVHHNWNELDNQTAKKILLYSGGYPDGDRASQLFDQIIVENESDVHHFKNSFSAFGTNTKVFKRIEGLQKMFPSFYPAAFALYKRHDLWAKAMPAGSIAVGHHQEHEIECYEVCRDNGHITLPTLPMDTMPYFYNQTQGVCLTADYTGGCQRVALEAMACNTPVLVTDDSKSVEFEGVWACPPDVDNIREAFLHMVLSFENSDVNLREDYIMGKYDESTYASKLELAL